RRGGGGMTAWTRRPSGLYVPAEERRPTAVDLFCGCGGFSLGILEAGFDVLAGVDNDCAAAQTYMVNLGAYPIDLRFATDEDRERFARYLSRQVRQREKRTGVASIMTSGSHCRIPNPVPTFWFGDIRKISGEQIIEAIGHEVGELDLVVGGPLSLGYLTGGSRNVMDPTISLVFAFGRLAVEMKSHTFCKENVPGMLSMVRETAASVVDELCRVFESGEYGEY